MLKTSQKYLASHFLTPFIMSTIFFVSFLLIFQMFRIIDIVVNKGVSIPTVLELVGHIAVSFLPMAIPLSALFATVFTLNRLSEDSEIVAMRSFGSTKFSLFLPFLIMGLFIALMSYTLGSQLIPLSKTKFKNTIIRLTSKGVLADIKPGVFFTEIPNVTIFSEKTSEKGTKFEDIFLHLKEKDGERVIFAKKGTLIKRGGGEWKVPKIRLHLEKGNIVKFSSDGSRFEKILFQEYDFPIINKDFTPGFITKDSMRTNEELKEVIQFAETEIKSGEFDDNKKKQYLKSKLEYYTRFNTPILCLVFVFLGFSLGIKKGRGHSRNLGLITLLVLVFYYATFFTGVSFSRKGTIPPEFAVILPSILLVFISAYFYKKLDWSS